MTSRTTRCGFGRCASRFLAGEAGPTSSEYAVILAVVVMTVIVCALSLRQSVSGPMKRPGAALARTATVESEDGVRQEPNDDKNRVQGAGKRKELKNGNGGRTD